MSVRDQVLQIIPEDDEVLFLEPAAYDAAIVGVGERFGGLMAVVYDRDLVIEQLLQDMDAQEAEEFFEVNIIGAWMGERTPIFITRVFHDESES